MEGVVDSDPLFWEYQMSKGQIRLPRDDNHPVQVFTANPLFHTVLTLPPGGSIQWDIPEAVNVYCFDVSTTVEKRFNSNARGLQYRDGGIGPHGPFGVHPTLASILFVDISGEGGTVIIEAM